MADTPVEMTAARTANPSALPAFHVAMQAIVATPKADVEAELERQRREKAEKPEAAGQ